MSAQRDVERLSTFTDGVMIISMTLLVLDIRLPDGVSELDDEAVHRILVGLWPKYLGYVISFLVIANYWVIHASKFRNLRAINGSFLWLNILFLLVVGFIPFVTSVVSESNGAVATILYASTMVVSSLILVAMWVHAHRKGLMSAPVTGAQWRGQLLVSLSGVGVFLFSIAVAQVAPDYARLAWLLLIPIGFLGRRLTEPGSSDPLSR